MSYTPSDNYPYLVRMSDPLVIRLDKLSILVGNTNFYAKINKGYYFTGFQVYVSGLGTPVYQREISVESTNKTMPNGDEVRISGEDEAYIISEAKKWLDALETEIAESTQIYNFIFIASDISEKKFQRVCPPIPPGWRFI